jgi:23S rRNA (uridine2552-2'-O)-methyltransferase
MREIHDKYFRLAKAENKLARSYYKLAEIDRREKLLTPATRAVIDFGAAPGSWLEYIVERVHAGAVIAAVDLKLIAKKFKPRVKFHLGDARELPIDAFRAVAEKFDVVLSDLAPNTSGVRVVDHARSVELCECAAAFALANLRDGGHFVAKIFTGAETANFIQSLRPRFAEVKTFKPDACRDESFETYVIAKNFLPSS